MERKANPSATQAGCADTLRLPEPERIALEEELSRGPSGNRTGRNLRTSARVPYDVKAGVHILLYHPGGTALRYLVRPRNISRGGIGFLHGDYVHHNSRCGLALREWDHRVAFTWGQVVRCRHLGGHIHEVGVKFEEPIDIQRFVENCLRLESEQQHSMQMPRLSGRILYVDSSEDERDLLKFHFEQLGLEVRLAEDGGAAIDAVERDTVDLILTELHLPTISGLETIERLRGRGHTGPILALSSDPNPAMHQEARSKGCDAVLTRPCNVDRLSRELAERLPTGADEAGGENCLISEHWPNLKMRPLILAFLGRLGSQAEQLRAHLEKPEELGAARRLCRELVSSAGGYGYPSIAEAAETLCGRIDAGAEPAELAAQMARVERLCKAARRLRSARHEEDAGGETDTNVDADADAPSDADPFDFGDPDPAATTAGRESA